MTKTETAKAALAAAVLACAADFEALLGAPEPTPEPASQPDYDSFSKPSRKKFPRWAKVTLLRKWNPHRLGTNRFSAFAALVDAVKASSTGIVTVGQLGRLGAIKPHYLGMWADWGFIKVDEK